MKALGEIFRPVLVSDRFGAFKAAAEKVKVREPCQNFARGFSVLTFDRMVGLTSNWRHSKELDEFFNHVFEIKRFGRVLTEIRRAEIGDFASAKSRSKSC